MTQKLTADNILSQILTCLDGASSVAGLVRASVHQTEGYLRGLQGLSWEKPVPPSPEEPAGQFLNDIRGGSVALRGRVKEETRASIQEFLRGLAETFPQSETKGFSGALSRLWVRWSGHDVSLSLETGRRAGKILWEEYQEGIAGELSANILDARIHLRNTRDYLRMRGWLQGTIEHLKRKSDWESREWASILQGNFSSIVLRALHNANAGYAAEAVSSLSPMMKRLDQAIENLAAAEPEACHFLRKNRATILTHALHSGYLDYPEEAAKELPKTLRELNQRISRLESESPEAARNLRSNVAALIYRALTNGKLDSLFLERQSDS